VRDTGVRHYPVSATFEPPFVVMVDLVGHGDVQAGADVSALLSNWGTWQPALAPTRRPSVVEALVGALGGEQRRSVLVDVGAGHGFFSLAAAARGHRVVAFELSAGSREALEASISYNGFGRLVTVHPLALGKQAGSICLEPEGRPADVHTRRGYGHPALHAATNSSACAALGRRDTLAAVLANASDVGALRVGACAGSCCRHAQMPGCNTGTHSLAARPALAARAASHQAAGCLCRTLPLSAQLAQRAAPAPAGER
jgi:FkbM family methyltransferase